MTKTKDKKPAWSTVFDMPLDELQSRVTQATGLMTQAVALFPGLVILTADERRDSNGRIRNGEGAIFLKLIAIIEAFPAFFEGLADLDEGIDPTKVETELMSDRVQRAEILDQLKTLGDELGGISDTVLSLRGLLREPMKEAYGIAKGLSRTNQALKSMLAPIRDFYSAMAKAAAVARKANEAARNKPAT